MGALVTFCGSLRKTTPQKALCKENLQLWRKLCSLRKEDEKGSQKPISV